MSPEDLSAAAGEPRLGTYGNNYGQPPHDWSREERLRIREQLWAGSSIPDLRKCGRVRCEPSLRIVLTEFGPRMGGLVRCHSVWSCPMCAPEIRYLRGLEISGALELHLSEDRGATFGTATLPHGVSDRLKVTYSAVATAWRKVNDNRAVRRFREAHGYWGFCRTCEVTHGANGWHPHVHWLDFFEEALSEEERREYEAVLFSAWRSAVVGLGLAEPSRAHGVKVARVRTQATVGEYLVKCDPKWAGLELTTLTTKQARHTSKGPFDILWLWQNVPDAVWWTLWNEYEQGTRGRRMLAWSNGLRDRIGVVAEEPDPEVGGTLLGVVSAEAHRRLTEVGKWRGAQWHLEAAAFERGQVGIGECVAQLLGEWVAPELVVEDPQLSLLSAAQEVGF